MGRIEISVEIGAPVEKVFAFYADVKNVSKTVPEDAEIKGEMTSEGPIGSGTKWHLSGLLGGRRLETEFENVGFEENRRIVQHQTKGDMKKWEFTQVFEATDRGTKVTSTADYELPYSVLGKIMDKLKASNDLERYLKAIDTNSKVILEKG